MADDFCIIHGYDHMKSQMGNPIPFCQACEENMNIGKKFSGLAVAGEDIDAGSSVMLALGSNLVFATGQGHAGEYVGEAMEQIREGFRVYIKDCEVREDDA